MSRASPTTAVAFVALAITTLFAAGAAEKPRPTPPPRVYESKDTLSPIARGLIKTRMDRHAQNMNDLLWAVVFLENDEAAALADEIASEPRIARPTKLTDSNDVNEGIPDAFFKLQDRLHEDARALSKAAKDGDDEAIAKSFGKLGESCVKCHAAFLD